MQITISAIFMINRKIIVVIEANNDEISIENCVMSGIFLPKIPTSFLVASETF